MDDQYYEPVSISAPLEVLREIRAALIECGQDLQYMVDAEYHDQMDSEAGQRRHARDRTPGNTAVRLAETMITWPGFSINLSEFE
jgi:hypothetical protein